MSLRRADPARTHAMLVGIEKYEAGGEWNRLSGPVRDVLAFHEWLRSRNVPADQIATLVSPLDENVALMEQSKITTSPATSAEVLQALDVLQQKRGDLLFLFWAGHGVVHEEEHRLFLADATANHKRNLDLDALLKSLRSSYFPGFPLQVLIVDACANYQRFAFTFPSEPVPCGDPLGHEQFVFFAARPGQVAMNLGEERRGLFAREFLSKVRELPDLLWPPDMRTVAESVQDRFAALRATSDLDQTPVWRSIRDWDGNVVEGSVSPQVSGEQGNQEPWKITRRQLLDLTAALSGVPIMSQPAGRDIVLAQMRSEISAAASRGSDATSDIISIIQTASSYAGGLNELLWLVYQFDGQSLSWGAVTKVVADSFPNLKIPALQSPGGPSASGARTAQLTLVDALAKCPTLASRSGRDICVSLLDDPIPSKIERQAALKTDLSNIVSTCLDHEGGIEALVTAVEAREKGSLYFPRVRECALALRQSLVANQLRRDRHNG